MTIVKLQQTPQEDRTMSGLVRIVSEVNIAALDKILAACQTKTNFLCAADKACHVRKRILSAVKDLKTCLPR